MNRCSGSAGRPRNSVTNQFAIAAKNAAIPHSSEPHEMRERERQAEEDRQARAPQVVVDVSRIGSLR